jgi:hypothetical protein
MDNGFLGDSVSINTWDTFEQIYDRKNPFIAPDRKKRAPGPVFHLKMKAKDIAGASTFKADNDHIVQMINHPRAVLGVMRPYGSLDAPSGFYGWSRLIGSYGSSAAYKNDCLAAFLKQSDQVPSKTSVINFIIELAELKPIAKALANVPKNLRNSGYTKALQKALREKRKIARGLPKKLAGAAPDTLLQWNFGWAPFFSDIVAFIGTVNAVSSKLDYLRKTRGVEHVVRFSKQDCYQHPQLNQVVYTHVDNSTSYERIVLTHYQCDFTSTWHLLQNLEGLDDAWAGLRGTIAYLGINNPAKIVWNAIPFSFIADWVGPFGAWLSKTAVQPFKGQWDVSNVTSSYHEKYTFDYLFTAKRGGTDGKLFSIDVDLYSRLDGLPFTLGAFDLSQLTDTQQKLAFSIPLSKVLK